MGGAVNNQPETWLVSWQNAHLRPRAVATGPMPNEEYQGFRNRDPGSDINADGGDVRTTMQNPLFRTVTERPFTWPRMLLPVGRATFSVYSPTSCLD